MKMANFLMPKSTAAPQVNEVTHCGSGRHLRWVPSRFDRGPIGDIAAGADGRVVVTNYGDDSVSLLERRARWPWRPPSPSTVSRSRPS